MSDSDNPIQPGSTKTASDLWIRLNIFNLKKKEPVF